MFVGIVLSIHWQHRKFVSAQAEIRNWSATIPAVQQNLSSATSIRNQGDAKLAEVLDAEGITLGYVCRTSPSADHILGFSGPTDVLLVFDDTTKLAGATILSSRDTRDHVEKVLQDPNFLKTLNGRTREELIDLNGIDAVSGATLTSYAILESIRFRLSMIDGAGQGKPRLKSLRFPEPPRLEDVRLLYANAATLDQDQNIDVLWHVKDSTGTPVGDLLRASPAADNHVGFQGPTDCLIAINADGLVSGVAVGVSFDNEPYVGYVREDNYFRNLFNGRDLQTMAALNSGTVEGVSGATMTSQAVAQSLQMAAQAYVDQQRSLQSTVRSEVATRTQAPGVFSSLFTLRNISTVGITLFGLLIGLTHLRGRRILRVVWQFVLIGWLGLINGDLVSQALLLGWAQSGIPWQNAFGLTFLTTAALLVPISTGRNVYCSHVCPHGAIQQLVRNRLPWQTSISPAAFRWLKTISVLLILWVIAIGMLHLPFSPVDIEPFDAWLWTIAGTATIVVAILGLTASLFVPMAYCRFGCPTGALLDYLSSAGGKSWTKRDLFVLGITILCAIVVIVS